MAYTFKANQELTNWAEVLFNLIEDMIAVGWRIMGSGDGLSAFENTGQTAGSSGTGTGGGFHVLTSGSSGANGMSNQSSGVGASWVRLRAPANAANPDLEYLWALTLRAPMSLDKWRLMVSTDGTGFNTGGDADTFPTAADGVSLAGAQVLQNSAADFRVFRPDGVAPNHHWAVGDSTESYGFIVINLRVTTEEVFGCWGMVPLQATNPGSSAPGTQDSDPNVHLVSQSNDAGNSIDFFNQDLRSGMFHCNSSTNARLEDNTTQSPERGAFAFFALEESGPPASQGCYSIACAVPFIGGAATWDHAFDDVGGLGADPVTSERPHLLTLMWARARASAGAQFWKGLSAGTVLGLTELVAAETGPVVDDDANNVSRLVRKGVSIPWPNGTAFLLIPAE